MIPDRPHKRKNPHKPKHDLKGFIKFTAIAVAMMVGFEYFAFGGGERPYITKIKLDYYARKQAEQQMAQMAWEDALPPEVHYTDEELTQGNDEIEPSLFAEKYLNITKLNIDRYSPPEVGGDITKGDKFTVPPLRLSPTQSTPQAFEMPAEQKKRVYRTTRKPKIAIVIDDVGMNIRQSRAAINLPTNVTLAMLPYASKVRELAHQAKGEGHELIIHAPMEALNGNDSMLGSMALKTNMGPSAFKAEFHKIANSFEGYVGVNNHMGSRLTQDREAMGILMGELSKRGLFFLDSKTINTSIAADVARDYQIPHATRDVFLDHEGTPEYVSQAINKIERIALSTGAVIAIGHPKEVTMAALKAWIPQAEARGFEFVPLSNLMKHPAQRHHKVKNARIQEMEDEKKVIVVNVEPTTPKARKVALPKISYPVD